MMRRGTLSDHDVASVLRQAASERLSGQIDIDGDRPAVVYLTDGELALACWADDDVTIAVDDDADDATYSAAILTEERRLRAATRDVLGIVLERDDGWYHHHPLGEHRAAALWSWPVEELLAEVAVRARRPSAAPPTRVASSASDPGSPDPVAGVVDETAATPSARDGAPPPSARPAPSPPMAPRGPAEEIAARRPPGGPLLKDRSDALRPRPPMPSPEPPPTGTEALTPVAASSGPAWKLAATAPTEPLDEAAWSVVVALAGSATEAEIVERLGWPAVKAEIVLRALEARGVVVADPGVT